MWRRKGGNYLSYAVLERSRNTIYISGSGGHYRSGYSASFDHHRITQDTITTYLVDNRHHTSQSGRYTPVCSGQKCRDPSSLSRTQLHYWGH